MNEEGVAWGEEVGDGVADRDNFLYSIREETGMAVGQAKLKVFSGLEWLSREQAGTKCCSVVAPLRGTECKKEAHRGRGERKR